jgi:hypothetical protein
MVSGPPLFIAVLTHDVDVIVAFTGSFAGLLIMLVFPGLLILQSRRRLCDAVQDEERAMCENPCRSMFASNSWVYATLVFAGVTLVSIISSKFL